jgi:hypothetical protein
LNPDPDTDPDPAFQVNQFVSVVPSTSSISSTLSRRSTGTQSCGSGLIQSGSGSSISSESGSGSNLVFLSKIAICNVQATGEAFSPQNRTYSTSKNEIYFLCLWVIFALLGPDPVCESGSEYGSRDPIESRSNPDTDQDKDPQNEGARTASTNE